MELRYYRTDDNWYIPQYKKDDGTWQGFKLKDLGDEGTTIHKMAKKLGKHYDQGIFGTTVIYHYGAPLGQEDPKDVFLIFKDEITVFAFLGAAKFFWGDRKKTFNL